jgi:beta-phosphoglucomutase
MTLRALFFDFDGVLVDSEPIHYHGFRAVLEPLGIPLSWEEYRSKYMGYGDRDAFLKILEERGIPFDGGKVHHLCQKKAEVVRRLWSDLKPLPGVIPFVQEAVNYYALGVVSGALREEILSGLEILGIRDLMTIVVGAEDTEYGKPHPDPYLKACALLQKDLLSTGDPPLAPWEGVAIEDTIYGLRSARSAMLYAVGVRGSEPVEELRNHADLVLTSLYEISPQDLDFLSTESTEKKVPPIGVLDNLFPDKEP